jgi:hypothetical protein
MFQQRVSHCSPVGSLERGFSYLKKVAVQLGDDTGDFGERSRRNFDAIEPLFVIDTAKPWPLKAIWPQNKSQVFQPNNNMSGRTRT